MKFLHIGLLLLLFQLYLECSASDHEERLLRDKFKGYNKLVRPVKNSTDILIVDFSLALFQIVDVDEKNEVMKTNVWLTMAWHDYQLSWNPEDYGGISVFRVPRDKIWNPDIVLFNNVDGKYEVTYKPNPVVYSSSHILYVPPSIYKSSCSMNVEFFPFDQQECEMIFGSRTYKASEVEIHLKEFQMVFNDYVYSGAWDVMDTSGITYVDTVTGRSSVKYVITIRRKTLFYLVNLITPCVLITFLCILLFYLPSDIMGKVTLGISILLALIVFLLLVSKILPPTSAKLSIVSKYLLFAFMTDIISTAIGVLIINWSRRNPSTYIMPKWIRILFLKVLPKILFMRRPQRKKISYTQNAKRLFDKESPAARKRAISMGKQVLPDLVIEKWVSLMKKTADSTHFIANHMYEDQEFNQLREDWKWVSLVIDRIQLYIFLVVTVSGTVKILTGAPYIFENVNQTKQIMIMTGVLDSNSST